MIRAAGLHDRKSTYYPLITRYDEIIDVCLLQRRIALYSLSHPDAYHKHPTSIYDLLYVCTMA